MPLSESCWPCHFTLDSPFFRIKDNSVQQFHADFVSTYLFVHSSALRGGNQYCWPPVTSAGSRCHNMSFGPDHPISRALDGDPRGKSHTKQSSPFNHTRLCVFICRISARLSRAPLRDAPAHPRCPVSGGCSAPTSRLIGDAEFGPRRRRSGEPLGLFEKPKPQVKNGWRPQGGGHQEGCN